MFFSLALLLYEYIITLGEESRLIWANIRTTYAAIFMVNRLNMLCMCISTILTVCPWHTTMVCISLLRHGSFSYAQRYCERQCLFPCEADSWRSCRAIVIFWGCINILTLSLWTGECRLRGLTTEVHFAYSNVRASRLRYQ